MFVFSLLKEEIIRRLLNKPFKIPIPNYQPSSYGKSLGLKRSGARQPLHDPYEENALILVSKYSFKLRPQKVFKRQF
jgi:DNA repair and recombination RAD54-like protein